jgi:hypothetical protein
VSRTFEALQKAERERKQGGRSAGRPSADGAREPDGTSLEPPPAERQKAALDLDRALQESLGKASGPVLLIPAVNPEKFADFVLDTVAALTLRLDLQCLVVDANLHAPCLHRFAGISRSRGVADLLGGRGTDVRRLSVSGSDGWVGLLPAGGGRPADEAWPERLAAWLDDVSDSFDRIFVAGPAGDDPSFHASLLDTVASSVLVVPSGGRAVTIPGKIEPVIGSKLLGIVAVG